MIQLIKQVVLISKRPVFIDTIDINLFNFLVINKKKDNTRNNLKNIIENFKNTKILIL